MSIKPLDKTGSSIEILKGPMQSVGKALAEKASSSGQSAINLAAKSAQGLKNLEKCKSDNTQAIPEEESSSPDCQGEIKSSTKTAGPANTNGVEITTIQKLSSGDQRTIIEERSGGTRAWRNNNPGNIIKSDFANKHGAIGSAGGFAVFPDESTGGAALMALLKTDRYQNLSINDAISTYAPPSENNTSAYQATIQKNTGLDGNTILKSLTDAQLADVVKTIRGVEGWKEGKISTQEDCIPAKK